MMRMAAPRKCKWKWNEQAFSEVRSILCSRPKLRYRHVCHCSLFVINMLCHPLCLHMSSGTTQPNQFSSCLEAAQSIFFFPYCKALVARPGPLPHLETTIRLSPLLCGYETGKIWGKPSNSPKFRANLWDLCWKIPTALPSSMSIIPPEVSTRIRVENPQVHPAAWHDARQSPPITEMKKQSWTGHETPCGSKNFGGRNLNCWAAKWRSGWSTSWTNICINICMHVYKYNICVHVRVWVLWTGKHWNKDAEKLWMKTTLAAEQSQCPQPC